MSFWASPCVNLNRVRSHPIVHLAGPNGLIMGRLDSNDRKTDEIKEEFHDLAATYGGLPSKDDNSPSINKQSKANVLL